MKRIPEPELMTSEEQARAYSEADFSEPHQMFVELFKKEFGSDLSCTVLDLGCGPADIAVRFAKAYPECTIHGVDGSEAMLKYGRARIQKEKLEHAISLILGHIPESPLPSNSYGCIIVNSLLHHLPKPEVLWSTIKEYAAPDAIVFVMDLVRPDTLDAAKDIVEKYCGDEPQILKDDFYNSLLAAYTIDEVKEQLQAAGLNYLDVKKVTDRHMVISGKIRQ